MDEYDVVLIDCHPSLGLLTVTGLVQLWHVGKAGHGPYGGTSRALARPRAHATAASGRAMASPNRNGVKRIGDTASMT